MWCSCKYFWSKWGKKGKKWLQKNKIWHFHVKFSINFKYPTTTMPPVCLLLRPQSPQTTGSKGLPWIPSSYDGMVIYLSTNTYCLRPLLRKWIILSGFSTSSYETSGSIFSVPTEYMILLLSQTLVSRYLGAHWLLATTSPPMLDAENVSTLPSEIEGLSEAKFSNNNHFVEPSLWLFCFL